MLLENHKKEKIHLQHCIVKYLHIRGPEQFKPVVFKGQLYTQKQKEDFKTQTDHV